MKICSIDLTLRPYTPSRVFWELHEHPANEPHQRFEARFMTELALTKTTVVIAHAFGENSDQAVSALRSTLWLLASRI